MTYPNKVDIPGYEGLYYATPEGEVYRYGKSKPMVISRNRRGCYSVHLTKDKKDKHVQMANIMKDCFFGGTSKKFKHLGGSSDFSVWNLVPMEMKEMQSYASKFQQTGVARVKDGEVQFFGSVKEAAEKCFLSVASVRRFIKMPEKVQSDGAVYMRADRYVYMEDKAKKGGEQACK